MAQLSQDTERALSYFSPEAMERAAPASEEMIEAAERLLGVSFPPSMRNFVHVCNGLKGFEPVIYAIPPVGQEAALVEDTLRLRSMAQPPWNIAELGTAVAIAGDSSGDRYALLIDSTDERGENPVAKVDHEDGSMRVVASCYERFLWFHLDKLQREFEPDGTDRNIYGFWVEEGEDERRRRRARGTVCSVAVSGPGLDAQARSASAKVDDSRHLLTFRKGYLLRAGESASDAVPGVTPTM